MHSSGFASSTGKITRVAWLERYSLNEEATRVLDDPDYEPLIVREARKDPKLRQALILSGVKLSPHLNRLRKREGR